MHTVWEQRLAQRTARMGASVIREMLKLTEQPDVISFAGGLPAAEHFPVEEMGAAAERVLRLHPGQALQYGTTEGYLPLREMIARHMARYGPALSPDNILITTGSQQALDLIGRVFVNPGDRILVESPTYLGALQAWNAYGAEYVTVPADDEGVSVDALEDALRTGPKFIYVLPNFQNPSGATLSLPRRERLVQLADRYGVPIVEDDPYGQLRYEGAHLQSVLSLDAEVREGDGTSSGGNVVYLSTFSKTLAPGLRVAWAVGPAAVIRLLAQAKQGADLHTATFTQMVAHETARAGFLDRHVRHLRDVYRARRDAMLAALETQFPAGARWTHPQGGLFVWCTLPDGTNTGNLLRAALEQKVAYIPGAAFHPKGGGENTMRLNFSAMPPERIAEGIARLGRVVRAALGAKPAPAVITVPPREERVRPGEIPVI